MSIPLPSRASEPLKCPHNRVFGTGSCPVCDSAMSTFVPPTTEQAFLVQSWAGKNSIEEGVKANDNREET